VVYFPLRKEDTMKGRPKGSKNKRRRTSDSQRRWNSENSQWKGDKVGRTSLHRWIERRKPKPTKCQQCNKRKAIDLANISGLYKRDINDYKWICRRCHMIEDGRINNLKQYKEIYNEDRERANKSSVPAA